MKVTSQILCYMLALTLLLLISASPMSAQTEEKDQGFGVAKFIKPNEEVQMTFHRAVLKDGKPQLADTNNYVVGNPLTDSEIETGFKTGEVVVVRVKSPYPYYIYVVNASEWDGTTLQYPSDSTENVEIAAGQIRDFAFSLENPNNKPATGREELLVMLTKTKIESPELSDILGKQGKIELTSTQVEVAKKELKKSGAGPTKWIKAISLGCTAASIFFPFAKVICSAIPGQSGFGVAKYIKQGSTTAIAPTKDTQRLTFRLSFPVSPPTR